MIPYLLYILLFSGFVIMSSIIVLLISKTLDWIEGK